MVIEPWMEYLGDIMKDKIEKKLDNKFAKLIKKQKLLPKDFFEIKWKDCETIPLFSRYKRISFLNKFPQEKRDLYLLKYSLKHLDVLIDYYCKTATEESIKNTLLVLSISDWDYYPEYPLRFNFFITYRCYNLFSSPKPFIESYTKESKYIIKLLEELGIADNYFVCDSPKPFDKEFQRVRVGLKKHPNPNLVTLDHFVKK